MIPQDFAAKWQKVKLSERSACQQHFLDLCDLLASQARRSRPGRASFYTFEKGVPQDSGGEGWADVWKKDFFGWEYKGKHKDLDEAYDQLLLYREDLDNPPLLVVCDMDRFEVHTNFTRTAKQVYDFDLAGLATPANLDILRKVFLDPKLFSPGMTARRSPRRRPNGSPNWPTACASGHPAQRAAHFLMKLMFCMFGEESGLPEGVLRQAARDGQGESCQAGRGCDPSSSRWPRRALSAATTSPGSTAACSPTRT